MMTPLLLNVCLENPFRICLTGLSSTWASYPDPGELKSSHLKSPPYKLSRLKLLQARFGLSLLSWLFMPLGVFQEIEDVNRGETCKTV